jgi:hypothetical protein
MPTAKRKKMGLDQWAYVKLGKEDDDVRELAYWRKHPNLQGWMEQLWLKRGDAREGFGNFNGVPLQLNFEDIDALENAIKSGEVAALGTTGFFFGNPSDDYYFDDDLKFCQKARAELFLGLPVYYNSSW